MVRCGGWIIGSIAMKSAGLALLLVFVAVPAFGDPISAKDATAHVGETTTVEGRVGIYRMPSGEIYLDLDGRAQNAPVSGYISRWTATKFPDIGNLDGKTVDITGAITIFRKRPEIFVSDPSQIAAK
jgi:hypothetical protein